MKIVLMYHDVWEGEPAESGFTNPTAFQYKVPKAEFERHVKAVSEYLRKHKDTEVEFTFDDGGRSFYTIIAPTLERYGMSGTFFVATAYIGTPGFMTADEVAELARRGHIIGSHSHNHNVMTTLSDEEISHEWQTSVDIITGIVGKDAPIVASIPNGDKNRIVTEKARKAGVCNLYTSDPTTDITTIDGMSITGRYVVYDGMDTETVLSIISSTTKRRKLWLKYRVLTMVKAVLGNNYNRLKVLIKKNL